MDQEQLDEILQALGPHLEGVLLSVMSPVIAVAVKIERDHCAKCASAISTKAGDAIRARTPVRRMVVAPH